MGVSRDSPGTVLRRTGILVTGEEEGDMQPWFRYSGAPSTVMFVSDRVESVLLGGLDDHRRCAMLRGRELA